MILTAACTLALTVGDAIAVPNGDAESAVPTTVGGAWTVGAGSTVGAVLMAGLGVGRVVGGVALVTSGSVVVGHRLVVGAGVRNGSGARRESWTVAAWANRRGDWSFGSAVVAPLVVGARKAPSGGVGIGAEQRAGIGPGAGLVAGV